VTFTAKATGGTAPYQFKYWLDAGNGSALARDWSTAASYTLTLSTVGTYRIGVWMRDSASTADTSAYNTSMSFVVSNGGGSSSGPLTLSALTSSRSSPRAAGSQLTFTATATGGTAPYQYKWWIDMGDGSFVLARDWSSQAT
jgi:hypothetical protein